MSQFIVAVTGADTFVGEAVIELLESRDFPIAEILLATDKNSEDAGYRQYKGHSTPLFELSEVDFSRANMVINCLGRESSEQWVPQIAEQGILVIDGSGWAASYAAIPLVIPSINDATLADFREHQIIASPNALALMIVKAVHQLNQTYQIEELQVSTYQPMSDAGQLGLETLAGETASLLNGQKPDNRYFGPQASFNVLPVVGKLLSSGYTTEETSIMLELSRLLETVPVMVSCAYVPVFFGSCASVHMKMAQPVSADEVQVMLQSNESLSLSSAEQMMITAVGDAVGNEQIWVSRIREMMMHQAGVGCWVTADNVRVSALNMVQIAELLALEYF